MSKKSIIPRVCLFLALCAYTLHRSTTKYVKELVYITHSLQEYKSLVL